MFFFFNDTATTEIYTLSLHDALPISRRRPPGTAIPTMFKRAPERLTDRDRKSTRLNSSHGYTSYAVFCLTKKKLTELIDSAHRPLALFNCTRSFIRPSRPMTLFTLFS